MFDFVDLKTVFVIFHLLGVIFGAGSVFFTDVVFFSSSKDKKLDEKEFEFMSLGSRVVWTGMIIIIISGVLLFLLDPERLLQSTKFQSKITVILILIVNGIAFHKFHLPFLKSQIGKNLKDSDLPTRKSYLLFASGAVSAVSWISVLILGSFLVIPYSYTSIMTFYLFILFIAVVVSSIICRFFIKK